MNSKNHLREDIGQVVLYFGEVFAYAKVKLFASLTMKFIACVISEVKFAILHRRCNFTCEANFTHEVNFTCPQGQT